MDGMLLKHHYLTTSGHGHYSISNTIYLPSPLAVIAEISLGSFDTASASYGTPVTAFAIFSECTTNGSNPPLPPNEKFGYTGGISGPPRPVLVRNGLISITYVLEVTNCSADFLVNLFFWPSVKRG